jgi:integrase
MPKLPTNMVRRKGRAGYYFRKRIAGKQVWIALGRDKGLAMAKHRELKGSENVQRSDLTVHQAAHRWLGSHVANARNIKGRSMAKVRVARYVDPFMGHLLLHRLTKEHMREYRRWLETQGISAGTVSHILADVRCLLLWAVDAGLLELSPFPRRLMPRLQERPPKRVTDEEADRLRAMPEPYGFVARLALGTGLRWGELTRAQASDVEGRFLVVHGTKSGKVRRVPLAPDLFAEVRGRVGRLVPFSEKSPGSFAKVAKRLARLERFHVHQMRHTFGCQWVNRGGSVAALQQILGHASIETTQRYARISDDMVLRENARLFGETVAKEVATGS